jgi:hypothetical protein
LRHSLSCCCCVLCFYTEPACPCTFRQKNHPLCVFFNHQVSKGLISPMTGCSLVTSWHPSCVFGELYEQAFMCNNTTLNVCRPCLLQAPNPVAACSCFQYQLTGNMCQLVAHELLTSCSHVVLYTCSCFHVVHPVSCLIFCNPPLLAQSM